MENLHNYTSKVVWKESHLSKTSSYTSYSRDHEASVKGKPNIILSSDPSFRGNSSCHNPEELLLISLSSCHMLWYLHFCSIKGIEIAEYIDEAKGLMREHKSGAGNFESVTLYPKVIIKEQKHENTALQLHKRAHKFCFIANSVNFEVFCSPTIKIQDQ